MKNLNLPQTLRSYQKVLGGITKYSELNDLLGTRCSEVTPPRDSSQYTMSHLICEMLNPIEKRRIRSSDALQIVNNICRSQKDKCL